MVTVGKLRQELFELYDRYIESDLEHYWKSSEGAVTINFPNYFEQQEPVSIEIFSYVFGNGRHHYFSSVDEALEEVRKWRRDLEEEILNPQEEQW